MTDFLLDPETLALISLAANIAANHPKKGLCQLERLRNYGVSEKKIAIVVDIARHLRDEAGEMLDAEFDREAGAREATPPQTAVPASLAIMADSEPGDCCCSTTAKGNPCC